MSGITNFLEVTILKTFFFSSLVISVFLLINLSNLSTRFGGFWSFLQPYSTGTKSSNAGEICIRRGCVKGAYIKDVSACTGNFCTNNAGTKNICIEGVYTRATCSGSACTGVGTCTKDACIGDTYTRGASKKNACIGGADAAKHLKI